MTIALLIAGFVCLIFGAEMLVRGSSRLAAAAGLSPLVVGLTVVAYGTGAPEVAVTGIAARLGQAELALGNVAGSNISNILLILGISALVSPLQVSRQLFRLDVPIMVGVSLLTFGLALDGRLGRIDGAVLFAGIVAFTWGRLRFSRRDEAVSPAESGGVAVPESRRQAGWAKNILLIAVGIGVLVVGSRWLVASASTLAEQLGVSPLVVGLTLVAVGTSLPEIATSVVAALRGEREIAVGNAVGSNIFNLLAVLGIAGLIGPDGDGIRVAPAALHFDLPVMLAVAVACLPIFFTGHRIERWEGGLFLAYYLAFLVYVVFAATEHDALPAFSAAMLVFVIPLTILTLGIITVRAWRARHVGP